MDTVDIPSAVKEAVLRVDPGATVILYGSRARGDARADSDWDFLILCEGMCDRNYKRKINHALFLVELECGEIISGTIRQRAIWESDIYSNSSLHANITRDGVSV